MRPINLIPEEERRSHGAASRTGPVAYIFVGSLAVLLIGVVMLVLASNQISDREGEVESLEDRKALVSAEAEKLSPYTSFQQLTEQRTQTIASLADSRFDWARVIRQLSLILPPRVYLTSMTSSAGGGEGGTSEVAGPSLSLNGCAPGQETVAGLVASLKAIDGVTRVELSNSSLTESEGSGGGSEGEYCSRGKKAQFEIVVAFDEAPPSPDGANAASLEEGESEEGESEEAAGSESGPAEAGAGAEASTSTSTGAAG